MKKGLHVNIYKWDLGDCSIGGISSKTGTVTLIGPGIVELFSVDQEKAPAVKIVERTIFGKKHLHAEPVDQPSGKSPMFGGAFIYSSDARFTELYDGHPIKLFDRFE